MVFSHLIVFARGTGRFSLSLSKNLMTWTHAVSGVLPDVRGKPCEDRPEVTFTFRPQNATYARFEVRSFYATGGALQYFEVAGPPKSCQPCMEEEGEEGEDE